MRGIHISPRDVEYRAAQHSVQAPQLVKQVERVRGVIYEINTFMVSDQAKESSRSRGWPAGIVDQFLGYLFAARGDFDDVPIVPVGREDVFIPR